MKTLTIWIIFTLVLVGASLTAQEDNGNYPIAAPPEKPLSVFDYLTRSATPELTLKFDMTALLNTRRTSEYLPATLSNAEGQVFNVEIRSRGKFRRKNCEVPPIKIKFSKSELRKNGLDTLNEIKLVIPCKDKTENEQLVIREYTAYRLFEHLSPASMRARVVNMSIVDTEGKNNRKAFCLLAEHEEEVAARLQGNILEEWAIKPERLNQNQTALMVLFEYMIGNTDWDVSAFRNVLLVQPADTSKKVLTIPYDFDFSGLVSAPYSSPAGGKGLISVRDRLLMADGVDPSALRAALKQVKNARNELVALCQSEYAPRRSAKDMVEFLNHFFDSVADKEVAPGVLMDKK